MLFHILRRFKLPFPISGAIKMSQTKKWAYTWQITNACTSQKDTTNFSSGTVFWKPINKKNIWFPHRGWEIFNISQSVGPFNVWNAWTNTMCNILPLNYYISVFWRHWVALDVFCESTDHRLRWNTNTPNIIKVMSPRPHC